MEPRRSAARDSYPRTQPTHVNEGISWLLQDPEQLQPKHCFMCLASRKPKGIRRDGRENRNAPKLGWCWAGNRHTWLGFASTAERLPN